MEQIWFYVPSPALIRSAPESISEYWSWIPGAVEATPARLGAGRGPCTWFGPYNWTIQTCLYLRQADVPCALSAELPDDGIVITHGDFLEPEFVPSRRQFIVEIKPDRLLQCRHANYVILQNERDPLRRGLHRWLVPSAVVQYWPQPGLLPRDASRGDRFENVRYMGNAGQFLSETDAVDAAVRRLGLSWRIMPRAEWHDYREADVVVAIRPAALPTSLSKEHAACLTPMRKPGSKLANAWLAGVPAVLSPDVAFRDLRRSPLDYLEASTVDEMIAALVTLRANPALRRAMRDNGLRRGAEFLPARTAAVWKMLLEDRILPAYRRWRSSAVRRRGSVLLRDIATRRGVLTELVAQR
jgi:hypothetical protein